MLIALRVTSTEAVVPTTFNRMRFGRSTTFSMSVAPLGVRGPQSTRISSFALPRARISLG
jgi:hypothetical protein